MPAPTKVRAAESHSASPASSFVSSVRYVAQGKQTSRVRRAARQRERREPAGKKSGNQLTAFDPDRPCGERSQRHTLGKWSEKLATQTGCSQR